MTINIISKFTHKIEIVLDFWSDEPLYGRMSSEHSTAYDHVHAALLEDLRRGTWPADSRLKVAELASRYGTAPGVVREALIRLSAECYIAAYPQRGFRTIAGSVQSVWEHATLRSAIEIEGTRLAIARGGLSWEADLAAAHHRLSHLESRLRRMAQPDAETLMVWSDADLAFHTALIAACGSGVLIEAQRAAFLRFRLHMSSVDATSGFRGADLIDEHAAILQAALDRDAEACAKAIRVHLSHYPERLLGGATPAAASGS